MSCSAIGGIKATVVYSLKRSHRQTIIYRAVSPEEGKLEKEVKEQQIHIDWICSSSARRMMTKTGFHQHNTTPSSPQQLTSESLVRI